MVDWGFAAGFAGIGFLTVFVVLGIIALTLWLTGFVLSKASQRGKQEISQEKES